MTQTGTIGPTVGREQSAESPSVEAIRARNSAAFTQTAALAFGVNVAGAVTAMLVQMLLARWLGETEYGLYAYAFSWLTLFTMISVAGWDNTSLRFVGAYASTGRTGSLRTFLAFAQRRVTVFSIALGLAAGLVLAFGRTKLGPEKFAVFLLACGLLPWNSLAQVSSCILQGLKRVVWATGIQGLLRPILLVAALAVGATLTGAKPDARSVVMAQLVVTPLVFIMLWWLSRRFLPIGSDVAGCSGDFRSEWRSVSRGMFAMTGSQYLLSQSDILLVGLMLGTTQAGIYAVASRLSTLVTFGITSLNTVMAPTIAGLHASGDLPELQRAVTQSSWYVVAYTIPIMVALTFAGRWLLRLFGPAFVDGYTVTLLLAAGQLVVALAGSVGFLLTMTGHQKDAATVVASTSLLAILLVAILTPWLGLNGAALGTLIATAARSTVLCVLVKRRLNIAAFAFHAWAPALRTGISRQ